MEETFIPHVQSLYKYISLCAIAFVAGSAIAFLAFRRKDFPIRPVSQLLGMFVALTALVSSIVFMWELSRTHIIVVGPERVLIGNEEIPGEEVKRAYIERMMSTNMIGQNTHNEVGILELDDGRTFLFDNDRYDLKPLMQKLQEVKTE